MNLSWSQKIFLSINKNVGKRPFMDKFMYFCGQWMISILSVFALFSLIFDLFNTGSWYSIVLFGIAFFIALIVSYSVAFLFPHQRPIKEIKHVKELIVPLGTWKSFPSDHTIAATLFAFLIMAVYDETAYESVASIVAYMSAILIMMGRIYCGVHYPRDIVGGIVFAVLSLLLAVLICARYLFAF